MGYKKRFHCFHGTTQTAYKEIRETKKFTFEKRENHWLGNGVYFFLDDSSKAKWWAGMAVKKEQRQSVKKESPCVCYIEANMDIDKVLDLNTEEGQKKFSTFVSYLEEIDFELNAPTDEKLTQEEQEIYARSAVMNLFVETGAYQASCYLFPHLENPYLFKGLKDYGISNNRGNQICIYDQSALDFSTLKEYK